MNRKEKGKGKRKRNRLLWAALAATVCLLAVFCAAAIEKPGRAENVTPPAQEKVDTGFVVTGPDSYDSADTAILVGRDEKEGMVTFLNLDLGKRYTLSMDGTTRLYDRYGTGISMEQIELGDIMDITFLKSKKHLTTMQMSNKSWSYSDVERYEINPLRGEVAIGSETYKITSNTQYLSEGRGIELMDLNASDVLSFQGIGNQVLTVRVEKGHGYLRLLNDEKFVGGWIEIGQSMVRRITEDMLLLVPEGSYQVNVTNNGGGGLKSVMIRRDEETALDVGDLEVPEPQSGTVLFTLDPPNAELFVDGAAVDASLPVTLEYGLHQLIARAEGYQSVTRYIQVAEESAGIAVSLDAVEASDEQQPQGSGTSQEPGTPQDASAETPTVSGNSILDMGMDAAAGYYKVYVDAPEGVEVYLDGYYVGTSPCSFRKVEGIFVITLRKRGYETKSYTVQIDDSEKDLSYSFADLVQNSLTNQ